MAAADAISTNELITALSPVLGAEVARTRVSEALRTLGLADGRLEREVAQRVLEQLAKSGGAAGAAARLAQRRFAAGATSPTVAAGEAVISRSQLVALLASTIGGDAAKIAVERGAQRAGMGQSGTLEQALATLDAVAAEPGVVGTTARFAKARLHLK